MRNGNEKRRVRALLLGALATACTPAPNELAASGSTTTGPPGAAVPASVVPTTSPDTTAASTSPSVRGIERSGSLAVPRAVHSATRLPDGPVLVVGGCTTQGCGGTDAAAVAELFDPATGSSELGASLATPRVGHTATPLGDGRVLIAGGYAGEGTLPLASAELYDPATGQFTPTGAMAYGRGAHTATLLADGRVLVTGGVSGPGEVLSSAEYFDATRGRFEMAPALPTPRAVHTATRLQDGRVLVVGGQGADGDLFATGVVLDPTAAGWSPAGTLTEARYKHGAVMLATGQVLVVGGSGPGDFTERLASAETWDPAVADFIATTEMSAARFKIPDAVVALPGGAALVAGGASAGEILTEGRFETLPGSFGTGWMFATATLLDATTVLVVGGYDGDIRPSDGTFLVRV